LLRQPRCTRILSLWAGSFWLVGSFVDDRRRADAGGEEALHQERAGMLGIASHHGILECRAGRELDRHRCGNLDFGTGGRIVAGAYGTCWRPRRPRRITGRGGDDRDPTLSLAHFGSLGKRHAGSRAGFGSHRTCRSRTQQRSLACGHDRLGCNPRLPGDAARRCLVPDGRAGVARCDGEYRDQLVEL